MSNLKRTSLFNQHQELKAKMVDFGGWEMPIQYNNLKEEVKAVRENVGVFDVSHMGEFLITGPEALNYIDFMVTNDIKAAQDLKAVYSPLCNENGHILDDLIVYKFSATEIFVCVNASNIEKDFNWFKKHVDKFDCKLENLSEKYSLLAIQGPKSFEVLLGFFKDLNDIDYYSLQLLENKGEVKTFAARTGYTGEDGFEIFAPHDTIKNLWCYLIDKGTCPCGLGSRDVLRLEVCFPLYGNELNDQVTPLDTGLKWTVKMSKESFIGKEALSDFDPSHRLIKLSLDKGIPRAGYDVVYEDGTVLGKVTSGSQSVCLGKGIALASIEKKKFEESKKLNISIRGKLYPAEVNKKPFVSGGHK